MNILVARAPVPDRILDLYAGSGAVGFEALSRGVKEGVFVEQNRLTAQLISENAVDVGASGRCQVVCARVTEWLRRAGRSAGTFDWIFVDPPYATGPRDGQLHGALDLLSDGDRLSPGGIVVAEHEWKISPNERYGVLKLSERRRYGQTAISFYTATTEAP